MCGNDFGYKTNIATLASTKQMLPAKLAVALTKHVLKYQQMVIQKCIYKLVSCYLSMLLLPFCLYNSFYFLNIKFGSKESLPLSTFTFLLTAKFIIFE